MCQNQRKRPRRWLWVCLGVTVALLGIILTGPLDVNAAPTGRVQFRVQGTTLHITNTKDRITTHLDLVGTARRNGRVIGRRSWRRATIGPNSTRNFTLRLRGPGICSDWDISGFMFQSSCD